MKLTLTLHETYIVLFLAGSGLFLEFNLSHITLLTINAKKKVGNNPTFVRFVCPTLQGNQFQAWLFQP
jgi:hypothetical protein